MIVGADTLTGNSQEPGWVPGLGPVTATEVRAGRTQVSELTTGTGTGLRR